MAIMAFSSKIIILLLIIFICEPDFLTSEHTSFMSKQEKRELKSKVLEMFDHGYDSYMKHAYPADELMPLSCKGRNRGSEVNRGDIDEALGNFSLTLIDTLDTLAVLGKLDEFEKQVIFVIKNVSFNTDVVVSVFETNIRVLGGLLGAHSVAVTLKETKNIMLWYKDELLDKAVDIADRLLPAFNTTTGIPYPKVNLRYGVNTPYARVGHETDTCTACAGTMIMEFGALSRLTGNPLYENKAHRAMDALWKYRSVHTDLVGTVINIHNGNWIRRDSGVGAGIDSYYEYCLKAYILFGDEWYLEKFNKHYAAIDRYVRKDFMLVDVLMHDPLKKIRSHMDALQAFWPGLQVLKGDIQSAIETHEMLYTVAKKFKFLPEAFTTDFNVHWAQHPLRPEFVESTYFLYQATKDSYYLNVGKHVIESLENYAKVPCGYAALKDLRTLNHEDKMDSFVLAETFKYLYLLFSEESEHVLDIDDFVFTTEAHLLPLYLATIGNESKTNETPGKNELSGISLHLDDSLSSCPNHRQGNINDMLSFPDKVRKNVKKSIPNMQSLPVCGSSSSSEVRINMMNEKETAKLLTVIKLPSDRKRKLKAHDFIFDNAEHIAILKELGITLQKGDDGKVQLMHQTVKAASHAEAEEGLLFMQEMIEISKSKGQVLMEANSRIVQVLSPPYKDRLLKASSSQFGADLSKAENAVTAEVIESIPLRACQQIDNKEDIANRIVIIERGDCMFIDKVRLAQASGAVGVIIMDHIDGTSFETSQQFSMSGDSNPDDARIPNLFLFRKEGLMLRKIIKETGVTLIRIGAKAAIAPDKNIEVKDQSADAKESNELVEGKELNYEISPPKQVIVIGEDGKKTITTITESIITDENNNEIKNIKKKIEICPTSECDRDVVTTYENEQVKQKVSIDAKDIPTMKDKESKGSDVIGKVIDPKDILKMKKLKMKGKKDIDNIIDQYMKAKGTDAYAAFDLSNEITNGLVSRLKDLQKSLAESLEHIMLEKKKELSEKLKQKNSDYVLPSETYHISFKDTQDKGNDEGIQEAFSIEEMKSKVIEEAKNENSKYEEGTKLFQQVEEKSILDIVEKPNVNIDQEINDLLNFEDDKGEQSIKEKDTTDLSGGINEKNEQVLSQNVGDINNASENVDDETGFLSDKYFEENFFDIQNENEPLNKDMNSLDENHPDDSVQEKQSNEFSEKELENNVKKKLKKPTYEL